MQNIAKICKKLVKLPQKNVKLICTLYVVCMYFVCSLYVVCKTTHKLHMAICTLYVVLENYIKTTKYIQTTYKVHILFYGFSMIFPESIAKGSSGKSFEHLHFDTYTYTHTHWKSESIQVRSMPVSKYGKCKYASMICKGEYATTQ